MAIIDSMPIDFPLIERVRDSEIKDAISRLKIRKAPGHDGISNRLLKSAPPAFISFLAKLYNACLTIGYFPRKWKVGKIVAIPKPGKDPTLPESYRQITLLPSCGKMFERIIKDRFEDFELLNPTIKCQQFGFRAQHSTTQQVMRFNEVQAVQ